ncbi:MAG: hypothetical protein KKG00_15220 [Bacteroidetes bacterium]|nr:hypothetical protein [Bacteroidota bacterium]
MLVEQVKDFLIRCQNPDAFDEALRSLSAALLVDWSGRYMQQDGCYVMRAYGDPDYLQTELRQKRQCEVVGEYECI